MLLSRDIRWWWKPVIAGVLAASLFLFVFSGYTSRYTIDSSSIDAWSRRQFQSTLDAITKASGRGRGRAGDDDDDDDNDDQSEPLLQDNLSHVFNETLGFQEVKLISLPERTDKQDALVLLAALSGIRLDVFDGVDGRAISSKALPYTTNLKPGILGCWRAHMNVMLDMVKRRVSSALIFEDDADWDVSIKSQMLEFARGSRFVLDSPADKVPQSPYGDDWDLLWLGHCGAAEEPKNPRRWVIPYDPTVVPFESRAYVSNADLSPWDNKTRVVFEANNGCCTTAYAISLRGAAKVLYHLSVLPFNGPVDWGLSDLCRDHPSGFTCISPFPRLVGNYRPAGNTNKDSDIDGSNAPGPIREEGRSENLVFSARENMERMLLGKTVFLSEYPTLTGEEMDFDAIASAEGHGELLET